MERKNYQRELEGIITKHQKAGEVPTLLLHSCCAPCSSYVLEYLSNYFRITVFYYNPNISPESEYQKRVEEQQMLIDQLKTTYPVKLSVGSYEPERFYEVAKGLEEEKEGGARCAKCFHLRLEETAKLAASEQYDYFTTTLTISPLKNAMVLNQIGEKMGNMYQTTFLPSDFKKKNGYKRSVELSQEYGLYRQNYCGCEFSKRERED